MKKSKLDSIIELINSLESEGRLDPEIRGQIAKAIKDLSHGLALKNFKKVHKAIDRLSKILLNL